MLSLARILVPVDFSGRCRRPACYVEALASRFNSEITLLHVLPLPQYEFSSREVGGVVLDDMYRLRAAQAKKNLASHLREELGHLNVRRVLLEGDPALKIVEYAHVQRANLVFMPTHGHGPFRRFLLGSVTAKVLHDANCPVLTGAHLEGGPPPDSVCFRNVLVALDLGPQSPHALGWAAGLASALDARLTLIHAIPSRDLAAPARKQIHGLTCQAGASPEVLIEAGDAPSVICSAAQNLSADLLVIGRGSAAGVFGRLRTNAYAIIRQSPCPVASI